MVAAVIATTDMDIAEEDILAMGEDSTHREVSDMDRSFNREEELGKAVFSDCSIESIANADRKLLIHCCS